MPASVPGLAVAGQETGLGDTVWIDDVRDAAGDQPQYTSATFTGDGTNGVIAANAMPIFLDKKPVWDRDPTKIKVTVGGTAQTVSFGDSATSANTVAINKDTGAMVFSAAPGSAVPVAVTWPYVFFTDQTILNSLYAGLRLMFPSVGKSYMDTSIGVQNLVWDYTLPAWAQDPRTMITRLEVRDPNIFTEPWREVKVWKRSGDLTQIIIPGSQQYSVAGTFRVSAWGPYLTLGDLEPQLYHLPIWYALGTLLSTREAVRVRETQTAPLTNDNGVQPLTQVNLGRGYMTMFWDELKQLKRIPGPGTKRRAVLASQLNRFI